MHVWHPGNNITNTGILQGCVLCIEIIVCVISKKHRKQTQVLRKDVCIVRMQFSALSLTDDCFVQRQIFGAVCKGSITHTGIAPEQCILASGTDCVCVISERWYELWHCLCFFVSLASHRLSVVSGTPWHNHLYYLRFFTWMWLLECCVGYTLYAITGITFALSLWFACDVCVWSERNICVPCWGVHTDTNNYIRSLSWFECGICASCWGVHTDTNNGTIPGLVFWIQGQLDDASLYWRCYMVSANRNFSAGVAWWVTRKSCTNMSRCQWNTLLKMSRGKCNKILFWRCSVVIKTISYTHLLAMINACSANPPWNSDGRRESSFPSLPISIADCPSFWIDALPETWFSSPSISISDYVPFPIILHFRWTHDQNLNFLPFRRPFTMILHLRRTMK